MNTYAYIRVSTKEQNIDRQLAAIEPLKIPKDHIYCDHQSGKDFDRPAYQQLISILQSGDLLVLKSIDRLGRDYDEILVQWAYITKTLKVDIQVLDMELLDTRNKHGNLAGSLIADMVLQVMAYFAQTERESIHQRQAEGIAAAKAKGKHLGRRALALPEGFEDVCCECKAGALTITEAADKLGMTRSTFYRKYRMYTKKIVSESRLFETFLLK